MSLSIIDQSFSGTYAPRLIKRAIYGMDSLKKGILRVESGIKKLHTIDRMDIQRVLSPRQENPVDDGLNPLTIDGRTLIPLDLQSITYINPRNLETSQLGLGLADAILARYIPTELASQMFSLILGRAGESIEKGIWQGSTAYQNVYTPTDARYQLQYFNGLIQQMVNDPLVNLSTISPVAITTSNVLTIMDNLQSRAAIVNLALLSNEDAFEDMRYLMSVNTYQIYGQSLRIGTTFKGSSLNTGDAGRWGGFNVIRVSGMPDDTIIFAQANDMKEDCNLWVGMNSQSDWDLRVDRVTNLGETYGVLAKWKMCTNYGFPDQIFMYTTLTAASFLP